jgi:hypothetical protein
MLDREGEAGGRRGRDGIRDYGRRAPPAHRAVVPLATRVTTTRETNRPVSPPWTGPPPADSEALAYTMLCEILCDLFQAERALSDRPKSRCRIPSARAAPSRDPDSASPLRGRA